RLPGQRSRLSFELVAGEMICPSNSCETENELLSRLPNTGSALALPVARPGKGWRVCLTRCGVLFPTPKLSRRAVCGGGESPDVGAKWTRMGRNRSRRSVVVDRWSRRGRAAALQGGGRGEQLSNRHVRGSGDRRQPGFPEPVSDRDQLRRHVEHVPGSVLEGGRGRWAAGQLRSRQRHQDRKSVV